MAAPELYLKDIAELVYQLSGSPGTVAKKGARVGGHLGLARLDDNTYLEIGPDISAAYNVTPGIGIQAMVTPTWLANDNDTEFHCTKMGLGVVWSAPGA